MAAAHMSQNDKQRIVGAQAAINSFIFILMFAGLLSSVVGIPAAILLYAVRKKLVG